jgi:lactate racemase
MRLELPYGTHTYPIEVVGRPVDILKCAVLPQPRPVAELLESALDQAVGTSSLVHTPPRGRITLIISDQTRNEPRALFVAALRGRYPTARWTIAVATGTHGPADLSALGVPAELLRDATVVNHDGHRPEDLVDLGTTSRGTPVRLHRCVVEADLVIATGCIRPHYFAGFGAGAKAIFPGLGDAAAVRINHRLKLEPNARSGIVDGNPCRDDLEEAVRQVPTPLLLVNGVCDADDQIQAVVAGDVTSAFRAGCLLALPWYQVSAEPAPLVIASDAWPVTASLYQAAKVAAAAAPLVSPGGTLALVAECSQGIGPVDIVNEAIFRTGILPRLAPGVRLVLVSALDEAQTNRTLLAYGGSVQRVLDSTTGRVLVMPHASKLIAITAPERLP